MREARRQSRASCCNRYGAPSLTPDSAIAERQVADTNGDSLEELLADAERRGEQRRPVLSSVMAEPLDENFQPNGAAFIALARNISRGGISLLYTQPIGAKYLALSQPGESRVLRYVEVVRSTLIGYGYEIAGRFVERR